MLRRMQHTAILVVVIKIGEARWRDRRISCWRPCFNPQATPTQGSGGLLIAMRHEADKKMRQIV